MSLKKSAELIVQLAQEQAAYDQELDAYIAALKRRGGPEVTRAEMHQYLRRLRREADQERDQQVFSALRDMPVIPQPHEPAWRRWKEWSRDDFIRAVAWDQAHGGRGGKIAIARRCLVHPSALYRRWRAITDDERWPSGNKGPREP